MIESIDYGIIWASQDFTNVKLLKLSVKQRMKYIFLRQCTDDQNKPSIGRFCGSFKNKFEFEEYLITLECPLIIFLSKQRMSLLNRPTALIGFNNILCDIKKY